MAPLPADGPTDQWFRPVWEQGDNDPPPLPRRPRPAAPAPAPDGFTGVDLPAVLGPLAAAQDALPGVDAAATAAPEPVREGLIARLAFREAAGWPRVAYAPLGASAWGRDGSSLSIIGIQVSTLERAGVLPRILSAETVLLRLAADP